MFRVEWLQSALDELADLWTPAGPIQRNPITTASRLLDQRLKRNPHVAGESRSKGRRITFVPPYAVTFRIEPDGQTVTVLQVRIFPQRRP